MSTEFKKELRRFAESTTIKGVGRSVKATRKTVRVFWLFSLLACLGILIYQASTVILSYNKHIVIRTSGVVENQIPISPDVTVCTQFQLPNANLLRSYSGYARKIKALETFIQLHQENFTGVNVSSELFTVGESHFYDITFYALNVLDISGPTDDIIFQQPECDANCSVNPRLTASAVNAYRGYPTLQWCETWSCTESSTWSMMLDSIFTNNYFEMSRVSLVDSQLSEVSFGFNVMIQPRGTIPDWTKQIYIAPGTLVSIDVKQTNITRLQAPWGNCTTQTVFDPGLDDSPYDYYACPEVCYQRYLIKQCGCLDHMYRFTEAQLRLVNYTFCVNISNVLDEFDKFGKSRNFMTILNDAVKKVFCYSNIETVPFDSSACDCRPPCSEIQYTTTVLAVSMDPLYQYSFIQDALLQNLSTYAEIFNVYADMLKNSQNESIEYIVNLFRNTTFITDNFVDLSMAFLDKSVNIIADNPAMTWDTLAANLGSSFNMWLGISVPTAAELIELLYVVITIWLRKKDSDNHEQDDSTQVSTTQVVSLESVNVVQMLDGAVNGRNEMSLEVIVSDLRVEIAEMKKDQCLEMDEMKKDQCLQMAKMKKDQCLQMDEMNKDQCLQMDEMKKDKCLQMTEMKKDQFLQMAKMNELHLQLSETNELRRQLAEMKELRLEIAEMKKEQLLQMVKMNKRL